MTPDECRKLVDGIDRSLWSLSFARASAGSEARLRRNSDRLRLITDYPRNRIEILEASQGFGHRLAAATFLRQWCLSAVEAGGNWRGPANRLIDLLKDANDLVSNEACDALCELLDIDTVSEGLEGLDEWVLSNPSELGGNAGVDP